MKCIIASSHFPTLLSCAVYSKSLFKQPRIWISPGMVYILQVLFAFSTFISFFFFYFFTSLLLYVMKSSTNKNNTCWGRLAQRETVCFIHFCLCQTRVQNTPQAKSSSSANFNSQKCLTLRLWKMSEISQPQNNRTNSEKLSSNTQPLGKRGCSLNKLVLLWSWRILYYTTLHTQTKQPQDNFG